MKKDMAHRGHEEGHGAPSFSASEAPGQGSQAGLAGKDRRTQWELLNDMKKDMARRGHEEGHGAPSYEEL
jgi:hypothetical protein